MHNLGILVLIIAGISVANAQRCSPGSATVSCDLFLKPISACTLEFRPVCGIVDGKQQQFGNLCAFCVEAQASSNAQIKSCGPCK